MSLAYATVELHLRELNHDRHSHHVVLATLFVGAFTMGCAEMLVVGLIELIADDLSVTVPAAGALVTANALGLAIGGPLLTLVTTRFDRRHVLIAATAVFVLAQPAARRSVAGYAPFLIARVRDRRRAGTVHRRRDDDRDLHRARPSAPAARWRPSSRGSPRRARSGCRSAPCSVRRSDGAVRSSPSSRSRPSCWSSRSSCCRRVPHLAREPRARPGARRVRAARARAARVLRADLRRDPVGADLPGAVPRRGQRRLRTARQRLPARLRGRHDGRLGRRRAVRRCRRAPRARRRHRSA